MVDKVVESEINSKDRIAWGAAIVIAGLGIFGFYYFSSLPLIYRVLGLVLVFIFDVIILFNTEKGRTLRSFMGDARQELRKVVWATKMETVQTTIIVFVVVIIISIFLWLLDKLLGSGVTLLLSS